MTEQFDPLKALAKRAAASNDGTGRKLRFFDKCAAFACLYGGTKNATVCKAFGLSSATVSYLAGCRPIDDRKPVMIEFTYVEEERNPNTGLMERVTKTKNETIPFNNLNIRRNPDRRPRYQDVAREFDRLGEEMFLRTYYTIDIDARIARIEANRPKPGDIRTPFSFNPKSDSHAGVHNFGPNQFGVEECLLVDLIDEGWAYAGCNPDGSKLHDQWAWRFDDNDKPFRTSKAAYEHYLQFTGRRD